MPSVTIKLNNLVLEEPLNGEIDKNFHVLRVRLIYPNYHHEVMEKIMKISLDDDHSLKNNAQWKKANRNTPYHSILFKTPIEGECWIEVEISHGIKEGLASKAAQKLLIAASNKFTDLLPFGDAIKDFTNGIDFGPREPKPIAHAFIQINGTETELELIKAPSSHYENDKLTIPMSSPDNITRAHYAQGERGGPRVLVKEQVLKKGQSNGHIELAIF